MPFLRNTARRVVTITEIIPRAGLLAYCRAGFESDLAAELTQQSIELNCVGYAQAERDQGYVLFMTDAISTFDAQLPFRSLIFARQKLRLIAQFRELSAQDRLTPIIQFLQQNTSAKFTEVVVEHADTNAGRELSGLARSLGNAIRPLLQKNSLLSKTAKKRLHLFLVDGTHILLATSNLHDSSALALGIPRLKLNANAPSRSALKLEEAFLYFLDEKSREKILQPAMRAADLGAAPGGWTWVLTQYHLRVQAIDNGPMRQHVLDSGLVEHIKADGFRWQPSHTLDWMVCDMVEQPIRVAQRMSEWFQNDWCRYSIFNLKLPMKKRWQETQRCLELFELNTDDQVRIEAKQLYHDREEITVFAQR